MPQQDQHAGELNHAEEVKAVAFPSYQQPSMILQPGEEPFDFPAPSVTSQLAPVLACRPRSAKPVRSNQLDAVFLQQSMVEFIAVVALVGDYSLRLRSN